MGKDAHPHLTPGHGGRLSLLGCGCQCISRKPSNRWRCSGLAFHPSHPTALCSFLLTYPPHQTMLPWAPAASPTTLLPAPASSLFPLTPVFLLHLQETELCLSALKHYHSFSQITTVAISFVLTIIQTLLCSPSLPSSQIYPNPHYFGTKPIFRLHSIYFHAYCSLGKGSSPFLRQYKNLDFYKGL